MKRTRPLVATTELRRTTGMSRGTGLERGAWGRQPRTPINPVSDKRKAENRQRRAMITALYPERPRCVRPGCPRMADDIHENLSRARSGGIITDPDLWRPLCRRCHDEITFRPESELGWAYDAGLLVHSWDANGGDAA